jgi:hypothetical protein
VSATFQKDTYRLGFSLGRPNTMLPESDILIWRASLLCLESSGFKVMCQLTLLCVDFDRGSSLRFSRTSVWWNRYRWIDENELEWIPSRRTKRQSERCHTKEMVSWWWRMSRQRGVHTHAADHYKAQTELMALDYKPSFPRASSLLTQSLYLNGIEFYDLFRWTDRISLKFINARAIQFSAW